MNAQELNAWMQILSRTTWELENEYIDNEGEVTESTEAKENQIQAVKDILMGEGIDFLGRWLKGKEDALKALKAEKAYLMRRMSATENTITFIKDTIASVMDAAGEEKVKGSLGYAFTAYTSTTTTADKDTINQRYLDTANEVIHNAGVPDYIKVSLTASSSLVPEGEDLPDIFQVSEKRTVKFSKPRTAKEE